MVRGVHLCIASRMEPRELSASLLQVPLLHARARAESQVVKKCQNGNNSEDVTESFRLTESQVVSSFNFAHAV